jgi:hypothetical protein
VERSATDVAELLSAVDSGRVCAVAGQVQRDLHRYADRYRELFPDPPFDPAFFSTIALANAFCAPWLPAERLLLASRVIQWNFGLDRLIDSVAATRSEIEDVARRCLAVVDGEAAAVDALTRFLAEIWAQLAGMPAFPQLGPIWRDELRQVLVCMGREWEWRAAHDADRAAPLPSLTAYLDNARFGFTLVYLTQWIAISDAGPVSPLPELWEAGVAVERVIRLLNDLGTYHREARTGDLNALRLGATPAEVTRHIVALVEQCRQMLRPLKAEHAPLAVYLERHIGFNTGFYRVTDYQAPV